MAFFLLTYALHLFLQTHAAAVEAPATVDWAALAKELDTKSPLEIMDNVSRYCMTTLVT